MELFRVFGRLALEGQQRVQEQLRGVSDQARNVAQRLDSAGQRMRSVGAGMSVGLTAPLVLAGRAAVNLATDAEETANKFDTVFKGSAASARRELEEMGRVIPNTRAELEAMAAGAQDLLVPLGINRQEAAGMSTQFVKLAGDIAAFNNVSPERAMEAIRSALVGSAEPMLQFGVDTRKTTLEQHALAEGIMQAGQEMTSQQRAAAVLSQIMNQSADAIGAAGREADSAAGKQRLLASNIREVATTIGRDLMPTIMQAVDLISRAVNWFASLDDSTRQFIVTAALITATLGPVLVVFGAMASAVGKIIGLLVRFGPAFARVVAVGSRFIPIIGQVIAAITAAIAIWRNWDTIVAGFRATWEALVRWTSRGIEAFVNGFTRLRDAVVSIFTNIRDSAVNLVMGMVNRVRNLIDNLYDATVGRLRDLWNTLVGNSIIVDLADDVVSEMGRMATGSVDQADQMAMGVTNAAAGMTVGAPSGGRNGVGSSGSTYVDMRHSIFRDDKDMENRLRRSGVAMAGAF